MSTIEVKVPDIGDFKEVEIIEMLVKVGDTIKVDQSLITVESDKASMEIPASHAGVIKELKVKLGDKVAEGSLLLILEASESAAAPAAPAVSTPAAAQVAAPAPAAPAAPAKAAAPQAAAPAPTAASPANAPAAASFAGKADIECDMMVLGGGPGGYSAAFRAADLGLTTVLVERYAVLGGVCLNVGCIPSKALLHVAAVIDEAAAMSAHGVTFAPPQIDIDKLRGYKEKVISKMTTGLAGMAKARKVSVVQGVGQFVGT
ncbi:biotin/lipoyl-containing protein, partial [Herminiimonas sp.]|uniref:biotin/lipoyl-containing protein n=1 Tax=Herminiimonas sp. TaxID=1926289 RepID=UPI002728E659